MRMPASGSSLFTDADSYQSGFHGMLELLVTQPGKFAARLTWVALPKLTLFSTQETGPRLAYLSLPPQSVVLTFLTKRGLPLICNGTGLSWGDIMVHSSGERFYQRTTAACCWGSIFLSAADLMRLSRTIAEREIVPTPFSWILRPLPRDRVRLFRLHAQAGRIAETNLRHIGHPEVARALEQDLARALVLCLAAGTPQSISDEDRDQARILGQFETFLAGYPNRSLSTAEASRIAEIPEPALRKSCSACLGMTPSAYQRLRRLRLARTELLRSDPPHADLSEVAKRYGFADMRRFVRDYSTSFGASPFVSPHEGDYEKR
jgi:AraC-like DNA-binding protein